MSAGSRQQQRTQQGLEINKTCFSHVIFLVNGVIKAIHQDQRLNGCGKRCAQGRWEYRLLRCAIYIKLKRHESLSSLAK